MLLALILISKLLLLWKTDTFAFVFANYIRIGYLFHG